MPEVVCAATNCVYNESALCTRQFLKLDFVSGAGVDLYCATYRPRQGEPAGETALDEPDVKHPAGGVEPDLPK